MRWLNAQEISKALLSFCKMSPYKCWMKSVFFELIQTKKSITTHWHTDSWTVTDIHIDEQTHGKQELWSCSPQLRNKLLQNLNSCFNNFWNWIQNSVVKFPRSFYCLWRDTLSSNISEKQMIICQFADPWLSIGAYVRDRARIMDQAWKPLALAILEFYHTACVQKEE